MISVKGTACADLERVLYTREEIAAKVEEIGARITADYQGKSPVMICILKGAALFYADLIRCIDLPLTLEFMALSSYGSATKSSGVVKVDRDIVGKDVIVVEDIVDSGVTMNYIIGMLEHRGASSIRIAALMDKPSGRRNNHVTVDYSGFSVPDEFVVGYGLDFDQKYRNLPDIGVLRPAVYEK